MTTETLTLIESPYPEDALDRVAGYLREGKIVALPTETVYGLAARMDIPEALDQVRQLKKRPEERHFTLHLPGLEGLAALLPDPGPLAKRLMNRYWPGPLTLILPDGKGGTLGIRVPAKEVTREILRRVGHPIIMTSSNVSGGKPANLATEVLASFPTGLQAIVDGGPASLGESSTVLALRPEGPEILREGIITLEDARRTMGRRVLFVCTGNTCRSPMAAGILRQILARKYSLDPAHLENHGFVISSAGILAREDGKASPHAVEAMGEIGADISSHETQPVTPELLEKADLILTMGKNHLHLVQGLCDTGVERCQLVHRGRQEIGDPFGGTLEQYRNCLKELQAQIEVVARQL